METTLYKITFKDGRVFKVFCANSTQKRRFTTTMAQKGALGTKIEELENGIHTIKQWEDILKKQPAEKEKTCYWEGCKIHPHAIYIKNIIKPHAIIKKQLITWIYFTQH